MKLITTLFLSATLLITSGCVHGQDHSGAAAGAAIGAIAGTAVGAANRVPLVGAVTGALVGGLVGNAVDQNSAGPSAIPMPPPPPVYGTSTDVIVKEAPVVVVETPVIIDERIWVGNDLWIYSYHGFRGPTGHVRYQSRVPFHRTFIRGGVGYYRRR